MSGFDYETFALTLAQTIVLLVLYLLRKQLGQGRASQYAASVREDVLEEHPEGTTSE